MKRARRRGPIRRWVRRWWWTWVPVLVLGLAGAGTAAYLYASTPLPPERILAQTSFLLDREGRRLTALHDEEDRIIVPLERIPDHVKQAVLAAEDGRFYEHPGISILDIVRAGWADLQDREITQGASTVTQQLVRSSLYRGVGTERTITRKVKEAILALKLERQLTKDQILERYLNTIYLGDGAYGMQAASRRYFGKSVRDVDVAEAATLAGIIARPEGFNPRRNAELAESRRDWVLGRMASLGFISRAEAMELSAGPVEIAEAEDGFARNPSAWFIDYARDWLLHPKLSPLDRPQFQTYEGGLRITSTVDQRWQRAAIRAIRNHYSHDGAPDVALMAIDPDNGAVRAVASNLRYARNPKKRVFHPATFGCDLTGCRPGTRGGTGRQTGSAFKMPTLAAAVEEGISLRSTFSGRSPVRLDKPPCRNSPTEPWEPKNYGGSSYGAMDLFGATAQSVNTIYAQLIDIVGPDKVQDVAARLGVRSWLPDPPACAITLGAVDVNLLDMTTAFATIGNGGVRHDPSPVQRIETADGDVLWAPRDDSGERVMKRNDALQVVAALQRVVTGGTGTAANFGVPIFGKTGTDDDNSDAWFCGGSTELVACVWVGRHEGQITVPGITGGTAAAPVWRDFMAAAHEDLEAGNFRTPTFTGEIVRPRIPLPAPSPEPEEEDRDRGRNRGSGGGPPATPPPAPPAPPDEEDPPDE